MAVRNVKSERERMLSKVKTLLKVGESRLQLLVQVVGSKNDVAMSRIYTACISAEREQTHSCMPHV